MYMSKLLQTIEQRTLDAMRAKKEPDLSVLRLIKTAVKNQEIILRRDDKEVDDAAVEKIIKTQVKQLKDALVDFEKGGRQDLIDKTKAELEVLTDFLPEQMSDEEIRGILQSVIEKAENPSVGTCMGPAMQAIAGRADGARVRTMLMELLG